MLRINQLKVERKLVEGLTALPESTRTILDAWYKNAIEDVENERIFTSEADKEKLMKTMEAVNYANQIIRQGS